MIMGFKKLGLKMKFHHGLHRYSEAFDSFVMLSITTARPAHLGGAGLVAHVQ